MFAQRIPYPLHALLPVSARQTSNYDTVPLRDSLLRSLDFACLNRHEVRLSLGAAPVQFTSPPGFGVEPGALRSVAKAYQRLAPANLSGTDLLHGNNVQAYW